ncbi:uncharacterized protein SRS1_14643 [Sporisorium reilianum f. sp. reilianum]|uniref:Uncharacterized protein n=1 Tax=Sporisorium reilianum f. sp. reilianum TaxID=72559 RepID=A0A2N8UHP2_9BASI|nr:uncharacterized protein SRS1_14643 [Sporisorium reilianum f. sp. reilianum]
MATSSTSTIAASPRPRRHEVEIYAHALRTRLQFASFKALNGVGKTSLSDLTSVATTVHPLTPSLASNNQLLDQSPATTPALSQGESLPSSSQSSTRSTRSIYLDIFGTDFRPGSSTATPSTSKGLSRATSFASTSTPSKRPAASSSTSTKSLLDKAASSPQLGSPERKNGRFDWHNNPTPAMVAHETKLAAHEAFALPSGSPSKRRREASHNAAPTATNPLLNNTPRRSRMQSGGFLPNGHPASSLAQDLGLTAPRTPRSRHASGRHVFALQHQTFSGEQQDQAERDRVATTLAALAEARNASSGSDSSSGSDRPHTPPPPPPQHAASHGFASPSIRRNSSTFAHPPAHKRHKRNVSWSVLPPSTDDVPVGEESKDEEQRQVQEAGEDRAAADYLLFLASSPSPSTSIKRFSADAETVGTNGILSTPAQTSLWDPFHHSASNGSGGSSGGRRSRMQSALGWPRHTNLTCSTSTPVTPPPSARKLASASEAMVGLGFDAHTLSSASSSPASSGMKPAANAHEYMRRRASTASLRSGSPPRTPPPPCATPLLGRGRDEERFEAYGVTTPPNAPGAPGGDTTFSYADFVNVSPSPQPPSTGRFAGGAGLLGHYAAANSKTPTRTNRFRFDPRPM